MYQRKRRLTTKRKQKRQRGIGRLFLNGLATQRRRKRQKLEIKEETQRDIEISDLKTQENRKRSLRKERGESEKRT